MGAVSSYLQVHSPTSTWRLPGPPDLKCKPTPFLCLPLSSSLFCLFLSLPFPTSLLKLWHILFYLLLCYIFYFCMDLWGISPHENTYSMKPGIFVFIHYAHCCEQDPKTDPCLVRTYRIKQKRPNVAEKCLCFIIFEKFFSSKIIHYSLSKSTKILK